MANHINVSQGIQTIVCPCQSPLCCTLESPSRHHPTAREFWCDSNVPFKTASFIEKQVARVLHERSTLNSASLWIWLLRSSCFSRNGKDDVRQKALEEDVMRTWEQTTFQIQRRSRGEDQLATECFWRWFWRHLVCLFWTLWVWLIQLSAPHQRMFMEEMYLINHWIDQLCHLG